MNTESSTKQCNLVGQDKRSFGRDVPLRTYKGLVLTPVLKEEAYLSNGRMPTLNKEMSLQDVHMLLSINDKLSLQKRAIDCFSFGKWSLLVDYLWRTSKINRLQINVLYHFSRLIYVCIMEVSKYWFLYFTDKSYNYWLMILYEGQRMTKNDR